MVGFIWAHCRGEFYQVKGDTLYIKKWKRKGQTISIWELKKYAQETSPCYENGEVKFGYKEDWIIIPVSKRIGGYDFVNLLCDKMEVSRIYMEDIA